MANLPTTTEPTAAAAAVRTDAGPGLQLTVRPTVYALSALPEGHRSAHNFTVTVEYRGGGTWAVMHMGYCLAADGTWDVEPSSTRRADDWLATHRYTLPEALGRAAAAVFEVDVNGRTIHDVLARDARTNNNEGPQRPQPALGDSPGL